MANLTKKQSDALKRKMETELAQLVDETREDMSSELKTNTVDIDGNMDMGDEAVTDTLLNTHNAMIGQHLQQVRDLNSALGRIQADVYGTCIDCGGEIGFPRLSAYPTAKRCIDCQRRHEKTYANKLKSTL